MTSFLCSLILILTIVSCGRGESKNSAEFERQDEQLPEPDALQRLYRADLKSLNSSAQGQVTIRLVQDDFEVNIAMNGVSESAHEQRILTGKDCPDVRGSNFISLDSDIENVTSDSDNFPEGGIFQTYVYRETASRSRLLNNLGVQDFDLEDKIVVIYGTNDDPALPIACGELFQVVGAE